MSKPVRKRYRWYINYDGTYKSRYGNWYGHGMGDLPELPSEPLLCSWGWHFMTTADGVLEHAPRSCFGRMELWEVELYGSGKTTRALYGKAATTRGVRHVKLVYSSPVSLSYGKLMKALEENGTKVYASDRSHYSDY